MCIKLTEKQINTFHKVGFLVVENIFTAEEIDIMRLGFDDLQKQVNTVKSKLNNSSKSKIKYVENNAAFTFEKDSQGDEFVLRHLAGCTAINQDLKYFGQDPRLVNLAAKLLGSSEVDHLINQAQYYRSIFGARELLRFSMFHQDQVRYCCKTTPW